MMTDGCHLQGQHICLRLEDCVVEGEVLVGKNRKEWLDRLEMSALGEG